MHTDQDSESQMEAVTSVDDDFLSPDEVNYEETDTDAENAEDIRKQGLAIRELRTHEVSRAIVQACGGPANITGDDFWLRIRPGSNILIASTPEERTAERILNIKELELRGNRHSIDTHISTPDNLLKEVIHGLEPGTTEDELINNPRVRTQGVRILYARMLGKSRTAVLTFDGPIVPRYVYYYGGETSWSSPDAFFGRHQTDKQDLNHMRARSRFYIAVCSWLRSSDQAVWGVEGFEGWRQEAKTALHDLSTRGRQPRAARKSYLRSGYVALDRIQPICRHVEVNPAPRRGYLCVRLSFPSGTFDFDG
ncbi:hypothetical protein HPB49_005504 [Dermacentor silvarum]|uniref:Uncharacterized protein n=1 Tax=Dermacentor silvarum TaxID=543639 RepID=A0ACB8DVQ5_DERSI|nr:hypothetical protein HPB49_005504 [Dermacentor silvarum]